MNVADFLKGMAIGLQLAWAMYEATKSPNADIRIEAQIRNHKLIVGQIKAGCEAKPTAEQLEQLKNESTA